MQKVSLFHLFNLQTQSMLEPGDQIEKITTQKIFYQIFMNLYQHAKNQAILSFISKQWNLICRENFDLYLRSKIFDSIQDGLFGGCFTAKAPPPLKTVTHILNDWIWHNYTLPKEDPENIWIACHTPWILLKSAFFHRKSVDFTISRNIDIDCILTHNF